MDTKSTALPPWAESAREVFRAGTLSQFVLHGNVRDLVHAGEGRYLSLHDFLGDVLFGRFDLVVTFNTGSGLRISKGQEHFSAFQKILSEWTAFSSQALPRDIVSSLELLDRLLTYSLCRTVVEGGKAVRKPLKTAIVLDFVQYIAPSQSRGPDSATLVKLLDWSSNPTYLDGHLATVLITDSLNAVSRDLVENPYSAKIEIPLPGESDCLEYLGSLSREFPGVEKVSSLSLEVLAQRVVGLTLINIRHMMALAVTSGRAVDNDYLAQRRKELIEKECFGLLEFVESKRTLADVAGHTAAIEWLRADAKLISRGETRCLPMGYLLAGRIGTGKTWLTNCWAGEVGIPFVIFKNIRDKWAGATESNLEKILAVLKALGQVIVFVDEADQMAGKRGGSSTDGGLSGRIYGMLAKAMSNTDNRGKIFWVFATSRPDLLEVDLKRPGRLDVHIPLFPPQTPEERQQLFRAMTRKVGLQPEDIPELPEDCSLSGNEMEALLVRAIRVQALEGGELPEVIAEQLSLFRPMAHLDHLEYMDLVAVKECTDESFLPANYRKMELSELNARLQYLEQVLRL
ncbi:MAG: AAA family ATPase [Vulcanimicrobiota bacterium]